MADNKNDDEWVSTECMIHELELEQRADEDAYAGEACARVIKLLGRYGFPPGPAADMFAQIWDGGRVAGARQRERVLAERERQIYRHIRGIPDDEELPDEMLN